ncbi:hypothetical protein TI04_06545 [Achromatium sp. WMS2]|nr:hypothetical protein TI04_06545 [Achromatium sp. WMS2]
MVNRLTTMYRLWLGIATAVLPLSACNSNYYNKSLQSQIKDLQQQVQQLQQENTRLSELLNEAKLRYGIDFERITVEKRLPNSIFDQVFSNDPEVILPDK